MVINLFPDPVCCTMAESKEGMTLCIRLVRSFEHRNIRVRARFKSDLIVLVLHVWLIVSVALLSSLQFLCSLLLVDGGDAKHS